jgi:chromosomal replication initiator protein
MTTHSTALQQQHQRYADIRKRLMGKPVKEEKAAPVRIEQHIEIKRSRPLWRIKPMEFDDHVRLYRKIIRDYMAELSVEMRAAQHESAMELLPVTKKTPARDIIDDVLQHFPGVTWADLKGPRRCKAFVLPRQIAVYEVHRRRKDMSLPQIGRLFGGRDHTTALSSINKIKSMIASGQLKLPFASAE